MEKVEVNRLFKDPSDYLEEIKNLKEDFYILMNKNMGKEL